MVNPGGEREAGTSQVGKSSQFGGNTHCLLRATKRIWGRNGRLEPEESQLQTLQDEEKEQRPGPRLGWRRTWNTQHLLPPSLPSQQLWATAEPDGGVFPTFHKGTARERRNILCEMYLISLCAEPPLQKAFGSPRTRLVEEERWKGTQGAGRSRETQVTNLFNRSGSTTILILQMKKSLEVCPSLLPSDPAPNLTLH